MRYRVVRYDLRSHGRSADAAGSTAYGDLTAVLDALGIERAALVGLSAGASVAIDAAIAAPSRVTALVLASPGVSGYRSRAARTWMASVAEAARAGDAPRAADRWAETPLILIGAEDLAETREVGAILADSIRGSRLEIIPGAGHMLNFAAPSRFNGAVRRFIYGVWSP
jgi:pimeloyl-ACP methyl ester carboxylesterase